MIFGTGRKIYSLNIVFVSKMILEQLYKCGGRDMVFNVFLKELETCSSISEVFNMAMKYAKYFDVYSEILRWMRRQLMKYSYSNALHDLGSVGTIEGGELFQIIEFPPELGEVKSWSAYLLYHVEDTLYFISGDTGKETRKCKNFTCSTLYLALIYEDHLEIYTNIQCPPIYRIDIKLEGHLNLIETIEGLLLIEETSYMTSIYIFDDDGIKLISEKSIETIDMEVSYGTTMILTKQIIDYIDDYFLSISLTDYKYNEIETGNLFRNPRKIIPTGMTGIDMVKLPSKAAYVDAKHHLLYLTDAMPKVLFEFFTVEIVDSCVNIRDVVNGNMMKSFILDKPSKLAMTRRADGTGYYLWIR